MLPLQQGQAPSKALSPLKQRSNKAGDEAILIFLKQIIIQMTLPTLSGVGHQKNLWLATVKTSFSQLILLIQLHGITSLWIQPHVWDSASEQHIIGMKGPWICNNFYQNLIFQWLDQIKNTWLPNENYHYKHIKLERDLFHAQLRQVVCSKT